MGLRLFILPNISRVRLSPLDSKNFRRTYRLPGRLPEGPSKIEWQIIAFATADIYFFHFFAKTCSFAHTLNVFSQIWFTSTFSAWFGWQNSKGKFSYIQQQFDKKRLIIYWYKKNLVANPPVLNLTC